MGFYTYLWLREDGTPYYVGKGKGNRAYKSHTHHRPPKDSSRILIQEFPSEADAFAAEIFLIAYYGRRDTGAGLLKNRSDGGEGPTGSIAVSERMKRLNVDPEFRKKQLAGTDPKYPWLRLCITPERNKKVSESNKGRIFTPEHCRHLSEGKIGIPFKNRGKPMKTHCSKGHPRPLSEVGKTCPQCESLRWGKKWGKISGTPEYFELLSVTAKAWNHKRWHVSRGIVKADCQYCRGEKNGNAQDTSRSTTPDSSDAHQAEV
jgi:hypothetical protein